MLLSRKVLQRVLGALWLIDGLLQFQPQMFTMDMVNGVMKPMLAGQPAIFEPSLQFIVTQTILHLTAVNLFIGIVQVCLGLGFFLLPDRWVKDLVIASVVWALIVWYGGEGMSMLFTGTASILTGAPGAVLFYPLLGFAIYPRKNDGEGLLPRRYLRWTLAGFWLFGALLQLQSIWWQPGQISQTISGYIGMGGLDTWLVDSLLTPVSALTANIEIPLNIGLIVVFLALGIALTVVKREQLPPFLIASIVVSVIFWYFSQAFGGILSGMATDFNSGLLVVVMALAVWPTAAPLRIPVREQRERELRGAEETGAAQQV